MKLPAIIESEEAAMMSHARAALRTARGAFADGDPFDSAAMHAHVRRTVKTLADSHERDAARVLELALAGFEDAHEALADLFAERNVRSQPLGPALSTYVNILADRHPRFRQPAVRPPANFMTTFVIICMVMDLMQQFPGLRLRRRSASSKRSSAFSIVAAVLNEVPLLNVREEAIRKTWEKFGPPAAPQVWNWRAP